jgi:hypothetical protein
MSSSSDPNVLTTTRTIPRAKGKNTALFLKSVIANLVLDVVEGLLNLKMYFQQTDGSNVLPAVRATIIKNPSGWTVSVPPLSTAGGSGGSGTVQQFKLISDAGDYWTAYSWNGTTQGSTVINIIKPYKLRCGANAITSENVPGIGVLDYTYTANTTGSYTYYTRNVTGAATETDVIGPAALAGDIIYAIGCSTTIIAGNGATLLDINADGRAWEVQT